jgi:hypothetical protein
MVLWRPLHRALGWLFLPLGQHALHAYTWHVAVAGAVALVLRPFDLPNPGPPALNTAVQLSSVLLIWPWNPAYEAGPAAQPADMDPARAINASMARPPRVSCDPHVRSRGQRRVAGGVVARAPHRMSPGIRNLPGEGTLRGMRERAHDQRAVR